MRLVQVFRWLDGAAWSDLSEPRMDPPAGVVMHWSRLPDLPLAAVVGILEPWVGRLPAALIAAGIVPPILLALFFWTMAWMARPVIGRDNALLAALAAALSFLVTFEFLPGRVDHDNWQFIFAALAMGALLRLILRPNTPLPPLIAAGVLALALWVGGECLPWLLAFNLTLVALWIGRGAKAYLRLAVLCSAALSLLSLVLLVTAVPAALRLVPVCDGFGPVYAALPAFATACWGALWVVGRNRQDWRGRLGCAVACGAVGGALFLLCFPECSHGPFAQVDPRLDLLWRQHVAESQSLMSMYPGDYWRPLLLALAPILGCLFSIYRVTRGTARERAIWLAFAVWLMVALGLSVIELRVLGFAFLVGTVPLVGLALWPEKHFRGWPRKLAKPVAFGLLGPLLLLVLPPLMLDSSAIAPRPGEEGKRCDYAVATPTLDDPKALGGRPRLIAAPIHDGAELLFRTPHLVLGAPYHRNVRGNLDVYDFFATPDPEQARRIAQRRGIELVFFCPSKVAMWLPPGSPHFIDALKAGTVPSWLRPLPLPAESHAQLLQVIETAGSAQR
jgi:hypothetical protein